MKIHRFYVGREIDLRHDFWLHDENLLRQWSKVLRFRSGQEVVLYDGEHHDRLYKITDITDKEAHLELVTEFERKLPQKDIYLLWSLLKKDKNDWVLQKCTELGVCHFVPLIAERSEKTGFNVGRAKKIITEASEQCGRSDIPNAREPIHVETAIEELQNKITLLICEQSDAGLEFSISDLETEAPLGVFVGPEGGWSDKEKSLFKKLNLKHINLHRFTLRAETASVAAIVKLLQ